MTPPAPSPCVHGIPTTFDRDAVPSMAFLKVLPAEQRGVLHALLDALKSARSSVFRIGCQALDEGQIAQMACERVEVLGRVLPALQLSGFMLQDHDGAWYSPHLVERAIRRAERAQARAEQAQRLEAFHERQEAGEFAPTAGVKAMTSRMNAAKGGRPRKGETPEEAKARRAHEAVQQREMRLITPVASTPVRETGNQNQFSKVVLVSGDLGFETETPVSVDLESEKHISPSNSDSTKPAETETAKPNAGVSEPLIAQTVARVMTLGKLPESQAGFAKSICGRFLRDGVPPDALAEAVKRHTEKMALNGDTPQKMGVFKKPIEQFWAERQAGCIESEPEQETPREAWEAQAMAEYAKGMEIWRDAFSHHRDFTAVTRAWPDLAERHGLPSCPFDKDAYLDWHRPRVCAA
ncbi:hypothetical protein [Asaia sp. HN010]|uniref:hypothetical protein n=1 Tax=Asaia sp. HN010 TaxID=3081233 RepID=UPI003016826F